MINTNVRPLKFNFLFIKILKFSLLAIALSSKQIPTGYVSIYNVKNINSCFSAKVQGHVINAIYRYRCSRLDEKTLFKFIKVGDYYHIVSKEGWAIERRPNHRGSYPFITLYKDADKNSDNLKWRIIKEEDYYIFKAKDEDECIWSTDLKFRVSDCTARGFQDPLKIRFKFRDEKILNR